MWWETVLIALVPSLITMVVTNWFNRKKYSAEVKTTESQNMQTILETYRLTLEQYKKEIEDVNTRFTNYITEANKRAEANRKKIEDLGKEINLKNQQISDMNKKLDLLVKEACFTKGCSKRTYFRDKV